MRKLIEIQEAETLINKYYEGNTSVKEEKLLYSFLSQKNLPEQFEADKAILGYFAANKKKSNIKIIPLLRWTSIAASLIIGIIIINFFMPFGKTDSYAYIDGVKVTNIEQIKEKAFASINSWSKSENSTKLDTDELINQQLQLFIK